MFAALAYTLMQRLREIALTGTDLARATAGTMTNQGDGGIAPLFPESAQFFVNRFSTSASSVISHRRYRLHRYWRNIRASRLAERAPRSVVRWELGFIPTAG
jgi:hypothetical protein